MKKLFIATVIAIVAVGGALSSGAQVVTGAETGYVYDCTAPVGALCPEIDEDIITPDQGIQNPALYFLGEARFL